MCVITLVETVRPSDEQIRQMWDQNPKGGGGVAWRSRGRVEWKKGLTKDEMVAINKKLPMPYVLHFRQPSTDTSASKLACHPFQVDPEGSTGFEGSYEGFVLFHNGYWSGWRSKLEGLCIASGGRIKMPSGAWSDSRALALASFHIGFGFLEAANEKVICLGPGENDVEMFGGPWFSVKADGSADTFVVSNRTWERTTYTVTDRRSTAQEATSRLLGAAQDAVTGGSGGSSAVKPFRYTDGSAAEEAGREGDQQESVQKGAEGAEKERGRGSVEAPDRSLVDPRIDTIGTRRSCGGCAKSTGSGTMYLGKFFCWQCWAALPREQEAPKSSAYVGICTKCRISHAAMKTSDGDQWICHTCWGTNGKPTVYWAKDRAVGQAS